MASLRNAHGQVVYHFYVDYAAGRLSDECPDLVAYWESENWRIPRRAYTQAEYTNYRYERWYTLLP